ALDEVRLAIAPPREGETLRIGPAAEVLRIDVRKEGLAGRNLCRFRGRDERNREERAIPSQLAPDAGLWREGHLDLSAEPSGPLIDQSDPVRAVLAQPALRVAGDDQARSDEQTHATEPTGVEIVLQRRVGVVELPAEHLAHVHDGDARAPAMLQEL